MKSAFYKLPQEKRERIVGACLAEFGAKEYEKAALDRIVEAAGISKGGLYEYISSKEELYLFVVEHSYSKLYDFLRDRLAEAGEELPDDILDRFAAAARAAIDFYLAHPEMIGVIDRTTRIDDPALASKLEGIFGRHYARVFDTEGDSGLAFPRQDVADLIKWLLAKTRGDFLRDLASGSDSSTVSARYVGEWDFILGVMRRGVYKDSRAS